MIDLRTVGIHEGIKYEGIYTTMNKEGVKMRTNVKRVKKVSKTFIIDEKTCRNCVEKVMGSFYNERNFTFEIRS